jgi:hypothetical protein
MSESAVDNPEAGKRTSDSECEVTQEELKKAEEKQKLNDKRNEKRRERRAKKAAAKGLLKLNGNGTHKHKCIKF